MEPSGEVGRLIDLMPVGLKEAALDSPTARASVQHYHDQVDILEKWLDEYVKSTNRLVAESTNLENIFSNFTSHATLPQAISETTVDHDYSVLAIKKHQDAAKDYWMSMVAGVKRLAALVCDPIKDFQTNELKPFKESRKVMEHAQKHYDTLQGKYAALAKTTEPSSLREDAFQLHEARKAYLKALMDFFTVAPRFRSSLDQLIIRTFYDQWKDMKQTQHNTATVFDRSAREMERVKGWSREMEESERAFDKELTAARKQLEDAAELAARPSRDLDDYSKFTTPSRTGSTQNGLNTAGLGNRRKDAAGEKQGWLYLRTYVRKPTRIIWVKRWAFVRNGVFGWLVQSTKTGAVEESERIGVLLCAARPMPSEERRFCFELKTNKHTIALQAETQNELCAWLDAFDEAKGKALDSPASTEALSPTDSSADPAFAITAPSIPEFGTAVLASTDPVTADEISSLDRSGTFSSIASDSGSAMLRGPGASSTDEASKDSAQKIVTRLDLHKRPSTNANLLASPSVSGAGGIASLIAASHGSMPVGPGIPIIMSQQQQQDTSLRRHAFTLALRDMPQSSLAPATLANMPAPTSLSKAAVVVAGERGIHGSRTNKNGVPNGILANTWGSSNGSYVNRFYRAATADKIFTNSLLAPEDIEDEHPGKNITQADLTLPVAAPASRSHTTSLGRRKTVDLARDLPQPKSESKLPDFPIIYPVQLKTQDAQFRLLFPNVHTEKRLVLVFRATWNPNDQQEFPGRVYVTTSDLYFYSNHLGLVLTSEVSLSSIDEVTAAPGRECDFLFVHLREGVTNNGMAARITIKTFLEPLKLLQNRLNFLAGNSISDIPLDLENTIRTLLKMESETQERSPSLNSWEEIATPVDNSRNRGRSNTLDVKAPVRVDPALHTSVSSLNDKVPKFKLPAQPVNYAPQGYKILAAEREYDVSPKALFHVMFGDKSLLWQLLQHERQARDLKQGPWTSVGERRLYRNFEFSIPSRNVIGIEVLSTVKDYQFVDVNNDHLCYVVTDKRTPWHLPNQKSYRLVSKIVITHVAKSKCKLAVYTKVEWLSEPWMMKNMLERQALHDLGLDAQDLADLVTDQVKKLGAYSRTKKAIHIFGQVGQSTDTTQLEVATFAVNIEKRRLLTRRTLTGLVAQNTASAAESAFGTVLGGCVDFSQWLMKTFNAHSTILLILAFSILYNSWFVTRDGLGWWQERNTVRFMKRLGVHSDHVMSKSVHVSDIHDAMSSKGVLPSADASACYKVFAGDYALYDLDVPYPSSGLNGDQQAKKRMQDTRRRLGQYRHDLLVAMRVVNSIEGEVVHTEWENWVAQEHHRCRAIEPRISRIKEGKETGANTTEITEWYDTYCVSCSDEYGKIGSL